MKLSALFLLIGFTTCSFLSTAEYSTETKLSENNSLVKAGDKFVTLMGQQVNVGELAPNFKVVNESFSPITLDTFKGKNILISVVPSVDTDLCSIQTKKLNNSMSELNENTILLTISNDLPFAQQRFCKNEDIANTQVLSDSVWRDFGTKYGVLIKDMGLLTRSIFIIDSNQVITYKEIVKNISQHPNYAKALEEIVKLSKTTIETTKTLKK